MARRSRAEGQGFSGQASGKDGLGREAPPKAEVFGAVKPAEYAQQYRGDGGAYARYLAGMDTSMRQKVALTAAHLLALGKVADMGMGSGSGSYALAALYPALQVVGVDVSEALVERARERHVADNLSFVVGDVAQPVFEPGELDGIFNSSVLHHVTSFNGYESAAAAAALEVQARQLNERGVLIVRDFVDPGGGKVWLDLPANDGDGGGDDPMTCSTAMLFERFSREFRRLSDQPGFELRRLPPNPEQPVRDGFRRYQTNHKLAAEFVLRKDYRRDWHSEVAEEYTYFTQADFEAAFARLGLRVLASTPLYNPWIVRNRFRDRFELRDTDGRRLEDPATNFIIVGEKVPADEGVRLSESVAGARQDVVPEARKRNVAPEARKRNTFLFMEHYRHRRSGVVFDLARRPRLTLEALPWFRLAGDVFVLARKSYPRPILCCAPRGTASLDGATAVGYVTETLNVGQGDKPPGQTVEEALAELAHVGGERIRGFAPGATYYPSPGGLQEEVRSLFVEIEPTFVETEIGNLSGFSTSGQVRAIEARQLLRAVQVGGLADARLETGVYQLLAERGFGAGPWIGEAIELDTEAPATVAAMAELAGRPARRRFERADHAASSGFLELCCAEFEELDAAGTVIRRAGREFVMPRPLSFNTVATAPLRKHGDQVWLGIDDDDLPAAQCFNGNSQLLVAPAWRLPHAVDTLTAAWEWTRGRLEAEYGVTSGEIWELGGRYHPSPGVTPEAVYPIAVEVLEETEGLFSACAPTGRRQLTWVRLADALGHLEQLVDGHLRIVALRAGHALGLLHP